MGMFEKLGAFAQATIMGDQQGMIDALSDPSEGTPMTSMSQGCGAQLTNTDGSHHRCSGHQDGKCVFEPVAEPAAAE
jgi:hypothetical protein